MATPDHVMLPPGTGAGLRARLIAQTVFYAVPGAAALALTIPVLVVPEFRDARLPAAVGGFGCAAGMLLAGYGVARALTTGLDQDTLYLPALQIAARLTRAGRTATMLAAVTAVLVVAVQSMIHRQLADTFELIPVGFCGVLALLSDHIPQRGDRAAPPA